VPRCGAHCQLPSALHALLSSALSCLFRCVRPLPVAFTLIIPPWRPGSRVCTAATLDKVIAASYSNGGVSAVHWIPWVDPQTGMFVSYAVIGESTSPTRCSTPARPRVEILVSSGSR